MEQETPFLDAIRAQPQDVAHRLIYADWLEERADPRGELIRIEEEMRRLPVFSDRYWESKARCDVLRKTSPPEWIQILQYGNHWQPTFAHTPNTWQEWWRLVRVFVERWHELPFLPDVGGRSAEVHEVEVRLGRQLPPSVREWVAFAHDVRPQDFFFVLRDVYQMIKIDGQNAISLLLQCEADLHWAILHSDLQEDDPPVYEFGWDFSLPDPESAFVLRSPVPASSTVSTFALGYSLSCTHAPGGSFGTDAKNPEVLYQQLCQTFPVHFVHGDFEIFESENLLVQLHHCPDGEYLKVHLFKEMPMEKLPSFLLDQTKHGGWFSGMFMSDK
jgi:uncharacterized protein (TIGR02996 family)